MQIEWHIRFDPWNTMCVHKQWLWKHQHSTMYYVATIRSVRNIWNSTLVILYFEFLPYLNVTNLVWDESWGLCLKWNKPSISVGIEPGVRNTMANEHANTNLSNNARIMEDSRQMLNIFWKIMHEVQPYLIRCIHFCLKDLLGRSSRDQLFSTRDGYKMSSSMRIILFKV